MTETNNVNNIISLLQQLDTNSSFLIFIPSLNQEVKFKQLTTQQLKRLLRTVFDTQLYNTDFTLTFNAIIKENCLHPEINTSLFTVYDKIFIFLKTRIECISPEYTFNILEDSIDTTQKTVSINDILNQFQDKQITFNSEIFTNDNCSITCNLPTLDTENKLENELHKNINNISNPTDLRDIIGDTFVNEVTKFISSITLNNTPINLLEYNFKDRIKIIEKLPVSLINKVIKYIENYRDTVKQLLVCRFEIKDNTDNIVVLEKELPFDATFFNA